MLFELLGLPPEIEALLRQLAESAGQEVTQIALAVLAFGLSLDDRHLSESVNSTQRGLDDFEQGQFSSFEESP